MKSTLKKDLSYFGIVKGGLDVVKFQRSFKMISKEKQSLNCEYFLGISGFVLFRFPKIVGLERHNRRIM